MKRVPSTKTGIPVLASMRKMLLTLQRPLITPVAMATMNIAVAAGIAERPDPFVFKTNDVFAFTGGANVVSAQESGYLEVLLNAGLPDHKLRFRNLGWEGDTVYTQSRELNFGSWAEQFKKANATVVVAEFGQMESLQGASSLSRFIAAYEKLLDEFSRQTGRIVLVSPLPFEKAPPPLPDLSGHNDDVRQYADAIRQIAQRRNFFFVDLFHPFRAQRNTPALTSDGTQLNQAGHWAVAAETMHQLRRGRITDALRFDPSTGMIAPAAAEHLRQSILARNRLWFDYWRPMNWAFLAGDRVEQPSSHDHRDPKIRWFPIEMERFPLLIEAKERDIDTQAAALALELK